MGVSAKIKNAISTYVWLTLLVMKEEAIVLGKKGEKIHCGAVIIANVPGM